jgi:hypothetical protein
MSMSRSITKTAAIAAASLVAGAAPGAVLAGPAAAHPQRRLAATSTHGHQRAIKHNRKLRTHHIRQTPHGGPQL